MLHFTFSQIQEQAILISQNGFIHFLVWMIVVDIATGIIKSFKMKQTNSTVGLLGIVKHLLVLLLVFVISLYLPLFGYGEFSSWFVIYLIIAYAISITENWVMLGLPMPRIIITSLDKLKDTMDSGKKPEIQADVMKVDLINQKEQEEE